MSQTQLRNVAAVFALGLIATFTAPVVQAGSGDLDPSFADHGRRAPIASANGAALFVESLDSGGILVGGGDVDVSGSSRSGPDFCTLRISGSNFASQLDEDGVASTLRNPPKVADIAAHGIARQPDGKIVVVGRRIVHMAGYGCRHSTTPMVFRLNGDGSLDTSFGSKTLRTLAGPMTAASVVVDQAGRIVIAGVRAIEDDPEGRNELAVLRLGLDGTLDESFGVGGFYLGPVLDASGEIIVFDRIFKRPEIRLIHMNSGSYRVLVPSEGDCKIVGVTADGAADAAFGSAGVATLRRPGGAKVACNALESATDGSLLVGGSSREHGFAARLLAHGAFDPGFRTDATITESMTEITSVAIASDGKLLVAGWGPRGASILRLQSTGRLDAAFGDAGRTWIDLDSDLASNAIVRDMAVREDGSVIAVGGMAYSDRPFVVRLLGEAGGMSRGIISFSRGHAAPLEADGKAIVRVRRSGGHNGSVSATYRTLAFGAMDHQDFVPKSGRLHWAAGDWSERAIAIDIIEGGEPAEALETFRVVLDDIQGGAGFGTRGATVDIQPDGSPGGQLEIDPLNSMAHEQYDTHQVILRRNYYFGGRVCVTLTAKSGTATAGRDFSGDPVTACWEDQEEDWQLIDLPIFEDNRQEGFETFTLELSHPTGGAVIGPIGSVTITLRDNE